MKPQGAEAWAGHLNRVTIMVSTILIKTHQMEQQVPLYVSLLYLLLCWLSVHCYLLSETK